MKISLSKKLDKEVYLDFREGSAGGVNFGKKISRDHPGINKDNYDKYVDDFYIVHEKELDKVLDETIKCFDDIKDALFSELQRYFGHDYGEGDYKCYLSIFDCNPRYIESKSFQVYYKRSYDLRKEVIAHELTHFAFYDFCHEVGIKDSNDLWELSEIFNVLFLNLPPIREAIGTEEMLFYPALKEKMEKVKKVWDQHLEAKDFIESGLKIIQ